jgi:hypothetical protein
MAPMNTTLKGYSTKKTIDVVSEKQKKQDFVRMLDDETKLLENSLEEAESNVVTTEVVERFKKETGFVPEEDKEQGIVHLTKTVSDKLVEVSFSDSPEDFESEDAEDVRSDENEEGEAEESEDGTEEEGEEQEDREHSFTVELKSTKPGKEKTSFIFQCFAKSDGSFVVTKMTCGNDLVPVNISYWNEDLQNQLIAYLDSFGINERLSFFIHQYISHKETADNISVLKLFSTFVKE